MASIPGLKKALANTSLSEKQISVLSTLIEGGPMFASAVARAAKLNRTTAYDILKELVGMGLASQTKKEGVLRYQSIAPELIPAYLERQREKIEESKKQITDLLPQIKQLRARGKLLPKVLFFEGPEGVKQGYQDILENNQEKLLRGITGMDAVYSNLDQTWATSFLKRRAQLGIHCIDLAPDTEGGRRSKRDDKKYARTTKFLPPEYAFEGDVSIYDNKVAIFSYANEHPLAVIIEDATIASMMKKIFDFMERCCGE
jgi:sugar-specific transcriptional regulator TrmB